MPALPARTTHAVVTAPGAAPRHPALVALTEAGIAVPEPVPVRHAKTRGWRVTGLVLLVIGVAALVALGPDAMATLGDGGDTATAAASPWAAVAAIVGATTVATCGLLLVVTVLAGPRPLATPRAWLGFALQVVAAVVIAMVVLLGVVSEAVSADALTWEAVVVDVMALALVMLAFRVLRRAWRHEAVDVATTLAADPRPVVLYLRSFADDGAMGPRLEYASVVTAPRALLALTTLEQDLVEVLRAAGPVVAIGRPGEPVPELGAARLYVDDARWRDAVVALMRTASSIVVQAGRTANLWWEIETARALGVQDRLAFVAFGTHAEQVAFRDAFLARFGTPVDEAPLVPSRWRALRRALLGVVGAELGRLYRVDADGAPRTTTIRGTIAWSSWVHPNRAVLRDAFEAAGLVPHGHRAPPRQSVAFVLAVLGGFVGAQHFYLGRRRLGLLHVLGAVTLAPWVYNVADAAALALMDEGTFRRRAAGGDRARGDRAGMV